MDQELSARVATYVATVNGRDIDAYAALFAEDCVRADPADQPAVIGRDAVREVWAATIGGVESLHFEASDIHPCGNAVAFHFSVAVVMGGNQIDIDGIEVFTFNDEGLLQTVHAYMGSDDVRIH